MKIQFIQTVTLNDEAKCVVVCVRTEISEKHIDIFCYKRRSCFEIFIL